MLKVLNKKIYIIIALLILPPLDFTAVELQEIKNIFFPEHFSMTTSNVQHYLGTINFSAT